MTAFTSANYLSSSARTEAEMKQAFEDNLAATKQLPGGLAASTLTLASDQITPTRALHFIDTELAAAADNLAQIVPTNLPDGSTLLLSTVSSSRTVVVKHAAGGTGQVSLSNNLDFTMNDSSMGLLLKRVGTTWVEIGRFYGNASAAHRAYYATAGLGQNTFTGRQEWDKGADLASAATLVLGTDGNYFDVTGAVTITAISAAPVGTRVLLQFDGALQLTHNATSLILPGGQNISTQAGTTLEFVSEGAGNWRLASSATAGMQTIDRQTGDITVASTTVETLLYANSLPAGVLGAFRRARLVITGAISGGPDGVSGTSLGTVTLTLRLKYGNAVIAEAVVNVVHVWTDGGVTYQAAIPPGTAFVFEGYLTARGATNVQVGHITWSTSVAKVPHLPVSAGSVVRVIGQCVTNVAGGVTIDSTTPQPLHMSVQWSSAESSSWTITRHDVFLVRE